MNPTFGDIIMFDGVKYFVIGEDYASIDGDIMVVANKDEIGIPIPTLECEVVSAGFHTMAWKLKTRYLEQNPDTLKGLWQYVEPAEQP